MKKINSSVIPNATIFFISGERMSKNKRTDSFVNRVGIGYDTVVNLVTEIDDTTTVDDLTQLPPYNIVKLPDGAYRVDIALPGVEKQDIVATLDDVGLSVTATVGKGFDSTGPFLHKGIFVGGKFELKLHVSRNLNCEEGNLVDGILSFVFTDVLPVRETNVLAIGPFPKPEVHYDVTYNSAGEPVYVEAKPSTVVLVQQPAVVEQPSDVQTPAETTTSSDTVEVEPAAPSENTEPQTSPVEAEPSPPEPVADPVVTQTDGDPVVAPTDSVQATPAEAPVEDTPTNDVNSSGVVDQPVEAAPANVEPSPEPAPVPADPVQDGPSSQTDVTPVDHTETAPEPVAEPPVVASSDNVVVDSSTQPDMPPQPVVDPVESSSAVASNPPVPDVVDTHEQPAPVDETVSISAPVESPVPEQPVAEVAVAGDSAPTVTVEDHVTAQVVDPPVVTPPSEVSPVLSENPQPEVAVAPVDVQSVDTATVPVDGIDSAVLTQPPQPETGVVEQPSQSSEDVVAPVVESVPDPQPSVPPVDVVTPTDTPAPSPENTVPDQGDTTVVTVNANDQSKPTVNVTVPTEVPQVVEVSLDNVVNTISTSSPAPQASITLNDATGEVKSDDATLTVVKTADPAKADVVVAVPNDVATTLDNAGIDVNNVVAQAINSPSVEVTDAPAPVLAPEVATVAVTPTAEATSSTPVMIDVPSQTTSVMSAEVTQTNEMGTQVTLAPADANVSADATLHPVVTPEGQADIVVAASPDAQAAIASTGQDVTQVLTDAVQAANVTVPNVDPPVVEPAPVAESTDPASNNPDNLVNSGEQSPM